MGISLRNTHASSRTFGLLLELLVILWLIIWIPIIHSNLRVIKQTNLTTLQNSLMTLLLELIVLFFLDVFDPAQNGLHDVAFEIYEAILRIWFDIHEELFDRVCVHFQNELSQVEDLNVAKKGDLVHCLEKELLIRIFRTELFQIFKENAKQVNGDTSNLFCLVTIILWLGFLLLLNITIVWEPRLVD